MSSTNTRSFSKALIWESGIFLLQTVILWVYLGNLSESLILNVLITIVKILLLFIYERIWKQIKWGKY